MRGVDDKLRFNSLAARNRLFVRYFQFGIFNDIYVNNLKTKVSPICYRVVLIKNEKILQHLSHKVLILEIKIMSDLLLKNKNLFDTLNRITTSIVSPGTVTVCYKIANVFVVSSSI